MSVEIIITTHHDHTIKNVRKNGFKKKKKNNTPHNRITPSAHTPRTHPPDVARPEKTSSELKRRCGTSSPSSIAIADNGMGYFTLLYDQYLVSKIFSKSWGGRGMREKE